MVQIFNCIGAFQPTFEILFDTFNVFLQASTYGEYDNIFIDTWFLMF